ncbi:MAG: nucleotidyltransferase domain-containing protein [Myxococcota bacterium]
MPTLLFGSHARGDARPDSDIDVLQLAPMSASYGTGTLSVTVYRPGDLRQMAIRGSLFVLHLCQDGILLNDLNDLNDRVTPDGAGVLKRMLAAWRAPSSYDRLFDAVREVSGALDTDEGGFGSNPAGFFNLATFLARTELYARCAAEGAPEFSITRAAARCGQAELGRALDRRRAVDPTWERFAGLRQSLRHALSIPCRNPHGSFEALVFHLHDVTPVGASIVLRTVRGMAGAGYHLMPPDDVPW